MKSSKRSNRTIGYDCNNSHSIFDPNGRQKCEEISELCLNQKITSRPTPEPDQQIVGLELEHPNNAVKADFQTQTVVSEIMFCNCCQIKLLDRDDQVSHYKCDWHRYNLHHRLKNMPPIAEEDFDKIAGDVSSISGSESDDSDSDAASSVAVDLNESESMNDDYSAVFNTPKIFFRNKDGELMSVYRCLIHQKKFPLTDQVDIQKCIAELPEKLKWIILMVSSGHFAGAIFNGKEVLEHKTFHRYTIRAKRGSAQSSKDNQGSAPKSAGASLRRYNEAALVQEVQELLASWSEHIKTCDFVFIRVPVANKIMLYGGKTPAFKKDDPRIRIIPLTTRRPTFNEIKRVHEILASLECYGKDVDLEDIVPMKPQKMFQHEKSSNKKSFQLPQNDKTSVDFTPGGVNNETGEIVIKSCELFDKDTDQKPSTQPETVFKKGKKNLRETKTNSENVTGETKLDGVIIQQRNSVYTACKSGDVSALKNSILNFHKTETKQISGDFEVPIDKPLSQNSKMVESTDHAVMPDLSSVTLKTCTDSNSIESTGSSTASEVADFLNAPVTDSGMTFLHVAAKEGHHEILTVLLESGADPALRDKSGKVPYILGDNKIRNAFRRFRADFPDKYDYTKAQIPSALTAEMENEKKLKAAEKRKAKKKAQNEKNKDKKAAESLLMEEKKEKDRFLALSDREKRALAAEKRFIQQSTSQGTLTPVLSRCWQCGTDITGKVPFEYADFKFCTTKCLREHRTKQSV